ncbi:MAG TPA: sensor histidine kinase [Anaeromyxobacteraceae bacterium]|nr:sensor histidine kinase [Anaeromyxobacteraceae bacterium]
MLGLTLVFNTVIAVLCMAWMPLSFGEAFVTSQVIGLCIMLASWTAIGLLPGASRLTVTLIGVPAGSGAAIALMALAGSGPVAEQIVRHPRAVVSMLCGALVFGAAVSFYFHATERISLGEARLREELLERVTGEKRLAEANLKLLQAQIEPHFLFNTLSNVLHLVDEKPAEARRMLENLTAYLRASLRRTRAGPTTLGEELELVRAYLEIQAVRLGDRLRWEIQAAPELRGLALPPLLVQPLVENAVRHGVEPKPGGGVVSVRAAREGDRLVLEIADTGLGMSETSPPGVGLANVRARVREVSGGRGELVLRPNRPEGLCAFIALPLTAAPPASAA